jgi:hypothetical protein
MTSRRRKAGPMEPGSVVIGAPAMEAVLRGGNPTMPDISSPKVVVYIGTSDVREIDHASWDSVGSKNKKIVWSRSNAFQVPVDQFDDEALKYLDELDGEFVIRDAVIDQ